ncbi:MAG: DUF2442 domain-containing protein [Anaerolineae bacterium]|nr:DUF2442 domain-containing protein [Anaerolineae bacterium]
MVSKVKQIEDQLEVKRFKIQYPISAYTFSKEALIHTVRVSHDYLHIDLTDGRILAIPLWWIPTVHNAEASERAKFEINQSRTMIIWDPNKCAINEEIRVADYLGPSQTT